MFVVSTSSQGSPWVWHMRILRFLITWAFSTNENCLFPHGRWSRIVKRALKKESFLFILRASIKDFFLPGSTISIPNVGKWCFSQFKFRFACAVSPFRVSEQVGSVTVRSSLLVRLRLFLCLFVLQSPFSVFRYLYKQIVWHWKHDISQGKPVVSPTSRFASIFLHWSRFAYMIYWSCFSDTKFIQVTV